MEFWLKIITKDDQELMDDIFVKLIAKIDKYKPERSKFHNFAYTLCMNMVRDSYKKKKKLDINYITYLDDVALDLLVDEETEEENNDRMSIVMMHAATLTQFQQNFLDDYLNERMTGENKEKAMFFLIKTKLIQKINEANK